MLITVLLMSGMLLGATVISGLLTVHQIRESGGIVNSAKAIYAADAGVELVKYRLAKDRPDCYEVPDGQPPPDPNPTMHAAFYANPGQYPANSPYLWSPAPYPATDDCYGYNPDPLLLSPDGDGWYHFEDGTRYKILIFYRSHFAGNPNDPVTEYDHAKITGKFRNSARAFRVTLGNL